MLRRAFFSLLGVPVIAKPLSTIFNSAQHLRHGKPIWMAYFSIAFIGLLKITTFDENDTKLCSHLLHGNGMAETVTLHFWCPQPKRIRFQLESIGNGGFQFHCVAATKDGQIHTIEDLWEIKSPDYTEVLVPISKH